MTTRNAKTKKYFWLATVICLALADAPVHAIDTLIVGMDQRTRGWRNIAFWGEVRQMTVKFDSLFKWDVTPNANLAPDALERGGRITGIFTIDDTVEVSGAIDGLERLIDGDPSTAFDPDDATLDDIDVPRTLTVRIDLGSSFSIDRIRLFPRLDRDHILSFPQVFDLGVSAIEDPADRFYIPISSVSFSSVVPNRQPLVDETFASRDVRYIQIRLDGTRPWELAELEIYSDGNVPLGIFTSQILPARHSFPVWGQVRYDGGDIAQLPISMQTRTGPDRNPIQYFRRTGVDDDLELVGQAIYNAIPEEEQGPILANPEWSNWETVSDGLVRSPSLNRFIQFRIFFPEAGTILKNLLFEYAQPPVVQELLAEIDPRLVAPGREETFTLSAVVRMLISSRRNIDLSTGFRRIQVLTNARITAVDQVLVDDVAAPFTASLQDSSFTVNLGRRIAQDGTFLQIFFRGAVFRDGTRFEMRVLDQRFVEGQLETVYQAAVEADVDQVFSVGGDLLVRLDENGRGKKLLANVARSGAAFTPNGDGANEEWILAYDLLKLTGPATVRLDLFDLAGQHLGQLYEGRDANGHYEQSWDGLDARGHLVPPGIYIYRLRVVGDGGNETHQGLVGVVY